MFLTDNVLFNHVLSPLFRLRTHLMEVLKQDEWKPRKKLSFCLFGSGIIKIKASREKLGN